MRITNVNSDEGDLMVTIDPKRCVGCGLCAMDCPQGCLSVEGGCARFAPTGCMGCGHCLCICPRRAIGLEGLPANSEEYDPAQFDIEPRRLLRFMAQRRSVRRFTVIRDRMEEFRRLAWQGYENVVAQFEQTGNARAGSGRRRINDFRQRGVDRLLFDAPLVVLVSSAGLPVDGGIASAYLELAAHALGLGACYGGWALAAVKTSPEAMEWLGCTEGYEPQACLLIGHPRVRYLRTAPRREADAITR